MERTSFIVHLVDTHGDHIRADKVFDVIYKAFPDAYLDVREFTVNEYLNIDEPERVE
jgi:hypothetical protein